MYTIISYAPNLEYLNVHSALFLNFILPMKNTNIKLKQFYLILNKPNVLMTLNELINNIKYFSSSLKKQIILF